MHRHWPSSWIVQLQEDVSGMMSTEYNDMLQVLPDDYGLGMGKGADPFFHGKLEMPVMTPL
jgi:hypothetical protein